MDKIQKIKEEFERRIKNLKFSIDENCVTEDSKLDIRGNITTLKSLLNFIDSLPEEPSEDLEEEIDRCYKSRNDLMMTRKQFGEFIHRFTEWQKQKDLEDSLKSDMTMPNKFYEKGKADALKEMKEALQTEYEKGRFDMREEMMKHAVEAKVDLDLDGNIKLDCEYEFHVGDKVKIIIVKED